MLSKLVTPEVLQSTPLKRISSQDSGQELEKGENTISLLRAEITIGDYTATKAATLGDLEASRLRMTDTTHNLSRKRRRRGQWKSKRKTIIQNMA
jgi:hypothetical protein